MISQTDFSLWVPPFLSYELRKLMIQTASEFPILGFFLPFWVLIKKLKEMSMKKSFKSENIQRIGGSTRFSP